MPRLMLTDEHWSKLQVMMLEASIYGKPNLRMTVEGILYRMRTGCPWRDLPREFGDWNAIYKRYNAWSCKDIFLLLFSRLSSFTDTEWTFIDASFVKAHQHSSGAAGQASQAIGQSVGGKTSKIHLAVDAYGLPVTFEITGGDVHESQVAPLLIERLPHAEATVADKGYDSTSIRELIQSKGSKVVIPRKKNSTIGNAALDAYLYKLRHLVENMFARLKHFRAVATRFDKLKRNFVSTVALACLYLWLPM